MLLLLLLSCGVMPYHRPPGGDPVPVVPVQAAPISLIGPALAHLDRLLGVTEDVDRRDRLVELRDLLVGVQLGDARVQERVVRYAERVLAVEERAQAFGLAESPMQMATTLDAVVEVEVPEPTDPLDAAKKLLGQGLPLDAIAVIDALPAVAGGAVELRKEAVDTWAKAEREAAGAALLAARALPKGAERTVAVTAVRDRLAAINARFPENSVAEDVRKHIETAQKELESP